MIQYLLDFKCIHFELLESQNSLNIFDFFYNLYSIYKKKLV
jgi:hypothetical protein